MLRLRFIRWVVLGPIVIVAALALLAIALGAIDLSRYRAPLEQRVSAALGRAVALDGAIRLRLAPAPGVTVRSVRIANPSWAQHESLAEARRLSLRFALLPLLRGRVEVAAVELVGGQVHLETDPAGRSNWLFDTARAAGEDPDAPAGVLPDGALPGAAPPGGAPPGVLPGEALRGVPRSLPNIELRDVQADYHDGASGVVTRVHIASARLAAPPGGPVELLFDGTLHGREIAAGLVGGALADLLEQDAPWPVRLVVLSGETSLTAEGSLRRLPGARVDLRVEAKGPEFGALSNLVGFAMPPLGPFQLRARFVRDSAGYALDAAAGFVGPAGSDWRFTVAGGRVAAPVAGPVELAARGSYRGQPFAISAAGAPWPRLFGNGPPWRGEATLEIAHTTLSLGGTVQPDGRVVVQLRARGDDLSTLEPLVRRELPPLGPYALAGRLERSGDSLRARNFSVRVGRSEVLADLSLALGGPRLQVQGSVQARLIDLDDLRVQRPAGDATPAPPAVPTAISTEQLAGLDAELDVRVDALLGTGSPVADIRGSLALRAGVLSAENVRLRLAGETIHGRASFRPAADDTTGGGGGTAELEARGAAIDYGPVLAALHITDRLSGRAETLEFTLRGSGGSLQEIWHSAALRLETRNATLTHTAPDSGRQVSFAIGAATATTGGGEGLVLAGGGRYRDQPFTLRLQADGLPELTDDTRHWRVRGEGTLAGARVAAEGSLRAVFHGEGTNLALRVQGERLSDLGAAFGVAWPRVGPYALAARLSDVPDGVRLHDLTGTLGASDVSGALQLRSVDGQPVLDGDLRSDRLRLADLLPARRAAALAADASPATEVKEAERGGVEPGTEQAPPARIIPDLRFRAERLGGLDLDVRYAAATAELGELVLHDLAGRIALRAGRLEVRDLVGTLWQGQVAGALALDTGKAPPTLSVSLAARELAYADAVQAFGAAGFRGGRANLALELSGRGAGLREALADATGRIEFFGGGSRIDNRSLDFWAANPLLELLPSFGEREATEVRCAVARFDVAQGRAETKSILVDADRALIKGAGSIAFADESVELLLWPEPRSGSLISVTTPVKVTGTLGDPSVTPEAKGVAEDVAWLLIGANNPLVLLLGYVAPNAVAESPCLEALAPPGDGREPVQYAPPNPISKTRDFFRGIGRFFERTFGGGG